MKGIRKKRSVIWKIGTEKLREVVTLSECFSDVLRYFGLQNKGGNYRTLRDRLEHDSINHEWFSNCKKMPSSVAIPLDLVMVEDSTYSRRALKSRIIKNKIIPYQCAKCGMGEKWQGETISLVLDHINGVSNDHRKENLRFLCPNCNSQTPTFCGKHNKKKNICSKCGKRKSKHAQFCLDCRESSSRPHCRKVERPDREELLKMLWEIPTTKIAEKYNVSGGAVAKWAKSYDISKPPRGYWVKQKLQQN